MGYMDGISLGSISSAASGGAAAAFSPVAAIGTMGAEAASAWYGNRMAQRNQHEAFDQQQFMYNNRYQMQVRDLQKAGLNPMLAYAQPAPMPGSVGQAPVQKPDMAGAMVQSTLASAQAAKLRQETENLKVEQSNAMQTGILINQQIQKVNSELEEIDTKIKNNKASEKEIQKRTELMDYQKVLLQVQAGLGNQELAIKTPEQIASGTVGAEVAAHVSRILKPLLDTLGQATRIK